MGKDEIRVLIGVPTPGSSKNDSFYDYWNLIKKPVGTICTFARGQSPARNRNIMIEQALLNNCTHVLFIDDDTAPPPDILIKLLAHDKHIVTGLYLMRSFPHRPIIFESADEQGRCAHQFLTNGMQGLVPIVAAGLGAVLIHTDVFKVMRHLELDKDQHGNENRWIRLGELESDHWCDDIGFFRRVKEAGFQPYCDLSICVGHFTQSVITPHYSDNGAWATAIDTMGTRKVMVPQPVSYQDLT